MNEIDGIWTLGNLIAEKIDALPAGAIPPWEDEDEEDEDTGIAPEEGFCPIGALDDYDRMIEREIMRDTRAWGRGAQ